MRPILIAILLVCGGPALADPAAPEAPATPETPEAPAAPPAAAPGETLRPLEGPLYPEEADGDSTLWLDAGGYGWWLNDRGPLGGSTPLVFGIGYGHQVGPARLAWRAHLFQAAPGADAPLSYLYMDFLSVEYVFTRSTVRPWVRLAIGFGLDLVDDDVIIDGRDPGIGDDTYFNEENGATGGFGLSTGAGVDVYLTDRWFLRAEGAFRAQGGAGRGSLLVAGHAGPGLAF